MPAGRPSDYTPDLADRICAQLSAGTSLRTVCRAEGLPDASTVFRWIRTIPEFRLQYEKAKEESADADVEDLKDIADDGSNDWMETHDKDGKFIGWRENGEAIQRSRLRVDVRKWAASKLKPKKYGEKLEHSGEITHSFPAAFALAMAKSVGGSAVDGAGAAQP